MTRTTEQQVQEEVGQRVALVFGASGEQGRAVVEGLVDRSYRKVYAFTRESKDLYLEDGLGSTLFTGDIQNPLDVERALRETKARYVFAVTTTELSPFASQQADQYDAGASAAGASDAAEAEYQVLVELFHLLKKVHREDGLERHVVLSCRDDVQEINRKILEDTGKVWIEPLDDGSVVPHYTAKGRGGRYGLKYLEDAPGIKLTLITLPFLYSNFLGFFAPLPNDSSGAVDAAGAAGGTAGGKLLTTQWSLTACFGDGSNKIDMMGASDLSTIVRKFFSLFPPKSSLVLLPSNPCLPLDMRLSHP